MKLATVHCPNPSCGLIYEAVMEPEQWHARCPDCQQENRVTGTAMGKEITGYCADPKCGRPLDDHIFGRISYACPPKKGPK